MMGEDTQRNRVGRMHEQGDMGHMEESKWARIRGKPLLEIILPRRGRERIKPRQMHTKQEQSLFSWLLEWERRGREGENVPPTDCLPFR